MQPKLTVWFITHCNYFVVVVFFKILVEMKFDRYLVKISALYVRYLKGATGYITPPSFRRFL